MRFSYDRLRQILPAEEAILPLSQGEFERSRLFTQATAHIASFLPDAPEGGWLNAVYLDLTNGLFTDPSYRRPAQSATLARLIDIFEALLACEEAPYDPLTDLLPFGEEDTPKYRRFLAAVTQAHFLLTLRISRELMPFDAASHTIGVRNIAVQTALSARAVGLPVDLPLIASAALCHDIGKFACRGSEAARVPYLHYYYTWQWLSERGMEDIAHISANHSTWDLEFENLTIESLLLIYADFRVRGERRDGKEVMRICSLDEAYDIIRSKLSNVTPEKQRRYQLVYTKLHDFEQFLRTRGVREDQPPVKTVSKDAALLSRDEILPRLRDMTFESNIRLMHTVSTDASFDLLLEQARGEKNTQRIRTYLRLFDEYNTYMSRGNKLKLLSFLYELLMYPEGDVRRIAGNIMGQLLANSGPKYRKELPSAAPRSAMAPTMLALLDQSVALWDSYIRLCLHPDHKIAKKHALRISNSLKAICETLFAEGDPALAAPLFDHFDALPETECFVVLDALCHVPPAAVSPALFARAEEPILHMLHSATARWQLVAIRCVDHLRACASEAFLRTAAQPCPQEEPVVTYLREKLLCGIPAPELTQAPSALYLSNLKNAVHWTVKNVQIDMLCDDVARHPENAFHTAMHLSNLLSVSEHLPVREHAGEALIQVSESLSVDQRNEICVDLLRELENGQEQISRFIPVYLGKLICSLPEKELTEAVDYLEGLLRSGTLRPVTPALRTLGGVIVCLPEGKEMLDRCLGLLLVGVAHYHSAIHQNALCVLCHDVIGNEALSPQRREYCFTRVAKKLLTLLSEPSSGQLTFFNRAAMLNELYRFMTHHTLDGSAFEAPRPVAFFPGTFDPFTAGHKGIVEQIAKRGFETYLAVDEFSWSKRTLAKLLRRKIVQMSVADQWDAYVFPDDLPINIAVPADLQTLRDCFPSRPVWLVAGSDVVQNASAYRKAEAGSAAWFDHILVHRPGAQAPDTLRGNVITLNLPLPLEEISSTRIRDDIDKDLDISAMVDPIVQAYIYEYGLYLRSPILKHVLTPQDLYFSHEASASVPPQWHDHRCVVLRSRKKRTALGWICGHSVTIAGLFDELHDVELCSAVRRRTSGKLLLVDAAASGMPQEHLRMLLNELLVRSLSDDHTYALCRCAQDAPQWEQALRQLGFVPIEEDLYYVDMRAPMVLIEDLLLGIKAPHRDAAEVKQAIARSRPRLRQALTALYPGKLLLCFDAELLNQALMYRVQKHNHVLRCPDRKTLGEYMCVPYGKVLSGEVVPNTVTKTLHADKSFAPDGSSFTVVEYPGYSPLPTQVRTLKSFRRPVILVDDLLHKGYRIGKLNPLFEQEGLEISRIIVGILSGRGRDLAKDRRRSVDCEYFIPNLHYWATESLLYPFIGGDSVSDRRNPGRMLVSANLILPYIYPRHFIDADPNAVRALSRTALENDFAVLRALERAHQRLFSTALTLRRLGEALERPRLPDRGKRLQYDFSIPASAYLEDDLLMLDRTRSEGGLIHGV